MFLVEKKLTTIILKKVYISRGGGQFGKSLHFDFFFFMMASLILLVKVQNERREGIDRMIYPPG